MEDVSESSDGTQDSDEEDVFSLRSREDASLPKMYLDSSQMRWHAAIQDVTGLLRDDVHLPMEPKNDEPAFTAVNTGKALPLWHCAFKQCTVCADNIEVQGPHKMAFGSICAGV